jgi:Ca2+-binding EF-hand superfamily protein
MTTIALASVLGLSLFAAAHAATTNADETAAGHPRLQRFLQNHPIIRERIIQRFDANKNGVLDDGERAVAKSALQERFAQRKAEIISGFDADHDGQLNPQERAAAKSAIQERRAQRRAQIMDRFDTNHDGVLDQSERQAARETIKARMAQQRGTAGKAAPQR